MEGAFTFFDDALSKLHKITLEILEIFEKIKVQSEDIPKMHFIFSQSFCCVFDDKIKR